MDGISGEPTRRPDGPEPPDPAGLARRAEPNPVQRSDAAAARDEGHSRRRSHATSAGFPKGNQWIPLGSSTIYSRGELHRDVQPPDGVVGGIGVDHFEVVEVALRLGEIGVGVPGAEPQLDETFGGYAKRSYVSEPGMRDVRWRNRH